MGCYTPRCLGRVSLSFYLWRCGFCGVLLFFHLSLFCALCPKLPVSLDYKFLLVCIGLHFSNIVRIIIVHTMVLFAGITAVLNLTLLYILVNVYLIRVANAITFTSQYNKFIQTNFAVLVTIRQ